MNLKQYENVYEYYSHMNDNNPLNITAVGESFWSENCFFERTSSEITAIEFVVSGNGVFENNGQKYYLGPKDVFLLRKGTNHKYYIVSTRFRKTENKTMKEKLSEFIGGDFAHLTNTQDTNTINTEYVNSTAGEKRTNAVR